jgi:dGTPase
VRWLRSREVYEKEEAELLAPFALRSLESAGRAVPEPEHPYRTAFQRDRDRVVHSRAFRRLEYKTQVFVYHEGDHYRNRLTHTLEGAQIARTVARSLRLNEDLAEAITLAHDPGHTPFGHAGERVLARLLADDGGFDHNRQSLRVVDWIEERYAEFRGLNLCAETREGMCKHGCEWEHPVPLPRMGAQRNLEGQVADVSDEIAYINHDLDDGLCAGVLTLEMLADDPLWQAARGEVEGRDSGAHEGILLSQTVIALINRLVGDLLETSARLLAEHQIETPEMARQAADKMIRFSDEVAREVLGLKRFLSENFYNHPRVMRMTRKAEWIVGDLYRVYRDDPTLLPPRIRARLAEEFPARVTADYLAGMTDRFAMAEHRKLLDPHAPA